MATCPANLSGIDPDFDAYSSNGERVTAAELKSDCRIPAAIPEVSNPSSCTENVTFAFDIDTDEMSLMKNSSSKNFAVKHDDILENEVVFAETVKLLKKTDDFSRFSSEETLKCGSESDYRYSDGQNSTTRQVAVTVVNKLPLEDENAGTPEELSVDNAIAIGISSSAGLFGSSVSMVGVHCPSCLQPFEEGKDVGSNKEAVCRPGNEKSEVRFSTVKAVSI